MLALGLGLTIGTQVANQVVVAPENTVAPVISGSQVVGQTLSTTDGTWTGSPTGYTYQWKRDGSDISGATNSTYVLVSDDAGTTITCEVTASNTAGSDSATSNGLAISSFGTPQELGTPTVSSFNSSSSTMTTNAALSVGDTVVVGVAFGSVVQDIVSLQDDSGDGVEWVSNTQQEALSNSLRMFSKVVGAGWTPGRTIQANYSGGTGGAAKQMMGLYFKGGGALDKNLSGTNGTSTSPNISYTTLASAPQMVVVFLRIATNTVAMTEPAGYSLITGRQTTATTQLSAAVVSATTAANPTWASQSSDWLTQMQSFTAL